MERTDLETWFASHPESHQPSLDILLDQCESEVRHYAHRDAWIHARHIAEKSLRRFEHVFGLPASDVFVTREVCHEIARELRRHEPHLDDEQMEWIGSRLVDSLDSEARILLRQWLKELAEKEEHVAWREIVYFTHHLAKSLIEHEHMTLRNDWDLEHTYPRIAARVARLMIREFDAHAAEPGRPMRPILGSH